MAITIPKKRHNSGMAGFYGKSGCSSTSNQRLHATPAASASAAPEPYSLGKEIMRIGRYKQSEYLMPWKWRKKNPVYRFILDIHYALYFSIFPACGRFRSDRKTWITSPICSGSVNWN